MSRIVAFHNSHNSSVCEIKDKEIIYVQEAERITRRKKSEDIQCLVEKYKNQHIETIVYATTQFDKDPESSLLKYFLKKNNITYDVLKNYNEHHLFHACSAYYKSGFDQSYVLVSDGGGKRDNKTKEIISCYLFKKNKYKIIFKVYQSDSEQFNNKQKICIDTLSIGDTFHYYKTKLNFKEPGSIMGLSSYSKSEENFLFSDYNKHFKSSPKFMFRCQMYEEEEDKLKIAGLVQKSSEKIILQYVKNIIKNKKRNLCVSGGVFQNTVINSKILDICENVHVDPFADDSGLSVGAALFELNKKEYVNKKFNNLYLGDAPDYYFINKKSNYVNYEDVAKLIAQGNIIAIYQGRNELGKRALGNRSFLFDPRDYNAKEKINLLKKREWFRPVAGTVLYEYRNEWFDLKSKNEAPFMSYVFNVKKEKDIPGITHIDGTCRVQTLKKEQNHHYYNLINAFYKITGVPILLNTSFNLAGEPLVNNGHEAAFTVMMCGNYCNYLYAPELNALYHKNNLN